jgi:hypothetical protein
MFGLGKKSAPKGKAPRRVLQQQRGPLRYLGIKQTMDVARQDLADVRGLEWIAYPIIALIAWRTILAERRKREETALAVRRAAIRDTLPPKLRGRKKRFILF